MINDDLRSGRLTWQDITEERTHGAYPTERELAAELDARNSPIPNHRDSARDTRDELENTMHVALPPREKYVIDRYLALYGPDITNPEEFARRCSFGTWNVDTQTHTPYPTGSYEAILTYLKESMSAQP